MMIYTKYNCLFAVILNNFCFKILFKKTSHWDIINSSYAHQDPFDFKNSVIYLKIIHFKNYFTDTVLNEQKKEKSFCHI